MLSQLCEHLLTPALTLSSEFVLGALRQLALGLTQILSRVTKARSRSPTVRNDRTPQTAAMILTMPFVDFGSVSVNR